MNKIHIFCAASALLVAGCSGGADSSTTPPSAPNAIPKSEQAPATGSTASAKFDPSLKGYAAAQAVFSASCMPCHGAGRPRGGIQLTDQASVLKGGQDGPIVVAGKPEESVLIKALRGQPGAKKMPPRSTLPEDQIKAVEAWVKDGAKA